MKKAKSITIKFNILAFFSLLYIIVPILIFFLGWLKLPYALTLILMLCFSVTLFLRSIDTEKSFSISKTTLWFIIFASFIWILSTGIGGFWVQKWDQHARNAVLHDLIDYSWPVIYPETGNALVYYFTFWLVPALFGKIGGWTIANIVLVIWSTCGIVLILLLLYFLLNIKSLKQTIVMFFIMVSFSGLCFLTWEFADAIGWHSFGLGGGYGWTDLISDKSGYGYGYQFTPNTALLKWVFNQTIVPWIITVLFLIFYNKIETYAILGVLLLPYSPIPFVGIFTLMVLSALAYLKIHGVQNTVKGAFSIANITAIISIIPIFYLFYKCNVAANGAASNSGFGLYVPLHAFTIKRIFVLLIFYFTEFGLYCILLHKEYKKNPLFYFVILSLILIPNFKIGIGHDFCMRACIPSLFILMVFIINYLLNHFYDILYKNVRLLLIIICLSFGSLSTIGDYLVDIKTIRETHEFPVIADDVKTFSFRPVFNDPEIFYTINFLSPDPYSNAFFKYFSRQ